MLCLEHFYVVSVFNLFLVVVIQVPYVPPSFGGFFVSVMVICEVGVDVGLPSPSKSHKLRVDGLVVWMNMAIGDIIGLTR